MRNYKEHKLSKTDQIIMDFFWNTDKTDIMARDVLQYAYSIGKNWNQQNVANYLKNLQKIGMIKSNIKDGKYYYSATMTETEFQLLQTRETIENIFNGSYSSFMAAIIPPNCSKEEIAELRKLLNEYEKEIDNK